MENLFLILKTASNNCLFYRMTGYYCPGCGGTRALNYLLQGDVLKSLYYHPLVVYFVFLLVYTIIFFIRRSTKNVSSRKAFPAWPLLLALGILLANWILKNAFILFAGIHLI